MATKTLDELVPSFLLDRGPLTSGDLEALSALPHASDATWRERAAPFLAGLIRSLNDVLATTVDGDLPLATYLAMRRLSPMFSELVEFTIVEHVARRDQGDGEDEEVLGVVVVETPVAGSAGGKIRVEPS